MENIAGALLDGIGTRGVWIDRIQTKRELAPHRGRLVGIAGEIPSARRGTHA
jgi:hypothetical protein